MSNDIQVTYEQVDSLVPYAMNAKKHSEKQVGQIANSIRSFGFVNPVLVASDNTIIAGHGRVHHLVDYRPFRSLKLVRKGDPQPDRVNEFGKRLVVPAGNDLQGKAAELRTDDRST